MALAPVVYKHFEIISSCGSWLLAFSTERNRTAN